MDDAWFSMIVSDCELPTYATDELQNAGFTIIPGPVPVDRLARFAAAHDAVMASGNAADLKVASTTTRLDDFVNRGVEFDDLYLYPPLLQACHHVIGVPFKLSSILGRTLRPRTAAQDLHIDIKRDSKDLPMVGFILMVDEFRRDNGATRFVPGSHTWAEVPEQVMRDSQSNYDGEVLACGIAGSLILFNGSVWHGHTANVSSESRRSIQGYFVRRDANSGIDWPPRMQPETLARICPLARYVLAL